jgi:PhoH-like ATPase
MMENGSTLRVELSYKMENPPLLTDGSPDNRIILTALALQQQGKTVFFVSKDINARVKAIALGLKAVDYEKQKVNIHNLYTGVKEIEASEQLIKELKDKGEIEWKDQLYQNQYVILKRQKEGEILIARYSVSKKTLRLISPQSRSVWGIKPLNPRQRVAPRRHDSTRNARRQGWNRQDPPLYSRGPSQGARY